MEAAMIPELDLGRLQRWVDARNEGLPEPARGLVRYELDLGDRTITIFECRPAWRSEYRAEWTRFPVARFRYTKSREQWSLYWRDRYLRFHSYDLVAPTPHIEELIAEIERDPTSIFWG